MMPTHILNWNVEWRLSSRPAGKELHDRIAQHSPDVVCLTETHTDFLSLSGHIISSDPDTGYPIKPKRRKVLLWSKSPWNWTLPSPPESMPSGRFVAGTTDTPSGPITFIGVCIPWSMAHVSSGQRNRTPWEDHHRYLDALDEYFASIPLERTVVLGDFNQRIPRTRAPKALYERLLQVFENRFIICTQGTIPDLDTGVIDHIAITPDLVASNIEGLSKMGADGKALTDHDGIVLTIT
jgi:exonuclease III